jgi:regulator of RNase E activity RraA
MTHQRLSLGELLMLSRWNTPSIYNGWEQITRRDISLEGFNLEQTFDFMPEMGPMVGYAVTLVIEPSEKRHKLENSGAVREYRQYVASLPVPKVVVVQDLDKPGVIGSFWGEVNASVHRALGCVGTITDGAIRDLDEMRSAGFKALARRLCVGHAYAAPVRWNCEVEVFGQKVLPGQLIHADKHGFLAIPEEDESRLYEAAAFMDSLECRTVIQSARSAAGQTMEDALDLITQSSAEFKALVREEFKGKNR